LLFLKFRVGLISVPGPRARLEHKKAK